MAVLVSFACPSQPCLASPGSAHRKILVIYSFDDLVPWQAGVRLGLQDRLAEVAAPERPDIFEERMDGVRIDSAVSDPTMAAYLSRKYAGLRFDVVVAESAMATTFLLRHVELFPGAERIAVDPVASEAFGSVPENTRLISAQGDWAPIALRTAVQVLPNLTRLIAIVDHSSVGAANKRSLVAAAPALPAGTGLDVWDDFTFDELASRVKTLPANSAILYSPVFTDRTGTTVTPRTLLARLTAVANAPILASHDSFLGTGIVGGRLLSARREGAMIADIALGPPYAQAWAAPWNKLNALTFDDAALKRWNIPDSRLPVPHSFFGRKEPAWRQYWWEITGALAALSVEALLIVWLVTALRQRRAAFRIVTSERDRLERRVSERTSDLLAATKRLEASNARLEELANVDALTGVGNRRWFVAMAEKDLRLSRQRGEQLAFLMLDIDCFKSINDRHGHATGDRVIKAMGEACRTVARPQDRIGRLGGEEFAILMLDASCAEALAVAERLRSHTKAIRVESRTDAAVSFTISVGVSTTLGGDDTVEDLASRADVALYGAKRAGRDRVHASPAEEKRDYC